MVKICTSGVDTIKLSFNYVIYFILLATSPIFGNNTDYHFYIDGHYKDFVPLHKNMANITLAAGKNTIRTTLRQHKADHSETSPKKQTLHFIPLKGDMAEFSLSEATPVGVAVYKLKAYDPMNRTLYYFLAGPYFKVDLLTGIVTLEAKLDREMQESFKITLTVSATLKPGRYPNTVSIHRKIYVLDVNDNPPVFNNMLYYVNISETTLINSELEVSPSIVVSDADIGENALINVECSTDESQSHRHTCSKFKIITNMINRHDNQVRLFLAAPLSYRERRHYAIRLVAYDHSSRPLTAKVRVDIYVWKDYVPTFLKTPYNAFVSENTPPNTRILKIRAQCGPRGDSRAIQNQVVLSLEGDHMRYFQLRPGRTPGTAALVTSEIPIDRESDAILNDNFYYIQVKATKVIKNNLPSDFAVEDIRIFVADVDDNLPKFNKYVINYTIKDVMHVERGDPLPLTIVVEDKDLGRNSKYSLGVHDVFNQSIGHYFSVNPKSGKGKTYVVVVVEHLRTLMDYGLKVNEFVFDVVAFNYKNILASTRLNINIDKPRKRRARRLKNACQ